MLKILLNDFLNNFRVVSMKTCFYTRANLRSISLCQKKDHQHNVWIYFPKNNKKIKIVMTISSKAILDNNAPEDNIRLAKR